MNTLEIYYIKLFHQHNMIMKEQTNGKKSPIWTNL